MKTYTEQARRDVEECESGSLLSSSAVEAVSNASKNGLRSCERNAFHSSCSISEYASIY